MLAVTDGYVQHTCGLHTCVASISIIGKDGTTGLSHITYHVCQARGPRVLEFEVPFPGTRVTFGS